ncbi:MAG: hypothetical protein PVG60_07185, partial [Desulfarculaceae bacterium]
MKRSILSSLVLICCLMINCFAASAFEYQAFTFADSGQPAYFDNFKMTDRMNGLAAVVADDLSGVTIYQTSDGSRNWSQLSYVETSLTPSPTGISVYLHPEAILICPYHWNPQTRAVAGRLLVSWD